MCVDRVVECRGFESHPRQLIFLRKSDCLWCAVLLCFVICLTLLASFFLPSHLSLKHVQCTLYVSNNLKGWGGGVDGALPPPPPPLLSLIPLRVWHFNKIVLYWPRPHYPIPPFALPFTEYSTDLKSRKYGLRSIQCYSEPFSCID